MKALAILLFLGLFFNAHSQENQSIEISKLESENFPIYKVVDKG